MTLLEQDQSIVSESNFAKWESNMEIVQSNKVDLPPNPAFLRGLARLLGQFEPEELAAHQPGIRLLLHDALTGAGMGYDSIEPDTPLIVLQRIAGAIASQDL